MVYWTGDIMQKEYLTVSQFAKKVGVTPQYVYKQLNDGKLSEYVEMVDGKKRIRSDALEVFQKKPKKEQTTEQQLIAILREQLQAKDKQIEELQAIVKAEQSLRYGAESRLKAIESRTETETVNPAPTPTNADTDATASHTDTLQNRSLWRRFLDAFRD